MTIHRRPDGHPARSLLRGWRRAAGTGLLALLTACAGGRQSLPGAPRQLPADSLALLEAAIARARPAYPTQAEAIRAGVYTEGKLAHERRRAEESGRAAAAPAPGRFATRERAGAAGAAPRPVRERSEAGESPNGSVAPAAIESVEGSARPPTGESVEGSARPPIGESPGGTAAPDTDGVPRQAAAGPGGALSTEGGARARIAGQEEDVSRTAGRPAAGSAPRQGDGSARAGTAVEPGPPGASGERGAASRPAGGGSFVIQIGAFPEPALALAAAERASLRFPGTEPVIEWADGVYRAALGGWRTRDDAAARLASVRDAYPGAWIRERARP